jgi:hypothetical protein
VRHVTYLFPTLEASRCTWFARPTTLNLQRVDSNTSSTCSKARHDVLYKTGLGWCLRADARLGQDYSSWCQGCSYSRIIKRNTARYVKLLATTICEERQPSKL